MIVVPPPPPTVGGATSFPPRGLNMFRFSAVVPLPEICIYFDYLAWLLNQLNNQLNK
jgi:hypothetical protein